MKLNELRDKAHTTARAKGWHAEGDGAGRAPALLINIHGEVSEAWEEYRRHAKPDWTYLRGDGKPEGIPSEIADVIIRCLDFCGLYGIDIESAVTQKMAYNETRPFRHGGKLA